MALHTVSTSGERCCLAIDGEVTIYSVAGLKAAFDALALAYIDLEVDLSEVTDLDTAGLQLMLMTKRIKGRQLRFVNHSAAVLDMLEFSNLAGAVGDPLIIAAGVAG